MIDSDCGPTGRGQRMAIDRCLSAFYARRPVTATFTGLHHHDHVLPDWSPDGLRSAVGEMRALRSDLDSAGRVPDCEVAEFPHDVDLALADGCLELQMVEHSIPHFYRRNPSIWAGEAIFGILSLLTRPFAPIGQRLEAATARAQAIPRFLNDARITLESAPADWRARALRECEAAEILFARSLPAWLPSTGASPPECAAALQALGRARDGFRSFEEWLRTSLPLHDETCGVGPDPLGLLLRRGHWCETPIETLAAEAATALDEAHDRLRHGMAELGASSWTDLESRLAGARPTADDYLPRFERTWHRFREVARVHDLVTWPEAPLRYVPIPAHTREAAPLLYYLFYRSPATFDRYDVYDYVVPPVDGLPEVEVERRLRAANDAAIALNHVVHHGGLGHHVQNHFAYRSASRIGRLAAIDAASRLSMFSGGSLAEGWACYACDLMEEVGALSPLERAAQQHTRVRLAARAVVDLALHTHRMTLDEAAGFYETQGLMPSGPARAEAVKTSMFPGTAVMYWLGTRGIHDLRARMRELEGPAFSLRSFHDRLLSYGALPVALIDRLMTGIAHGRATEPRGH